MTGATDWELRQGRQAGHPSSGEHCAASSDPRVDRGRGVVYQAEDTVARVMARADRRVRVAGDVLVLPAIVSFATIESMQRFVDRILAAPSSTSYSPDAGPVRVVPARGFRRASYRRRIAPPSVGSSSVGSPVADGQSRAGEIRVPLADPRGRWALTAPVLLHEIAHHLASEPGHGPTFRQVLTDLYREHLGPGAGHLLRTLIAPLDELPDARSRPGPEGQLARVAALLAKAQGTDNADEAEAYVAKAALVAQRHSIDMAVAALAASSGAPSAGPSHRMLTIGAPRSPQNKQLTELLCVISSTFGVRVDVGPGSTYALVYGIPGDLDQVESLYATAAVMMLDRATLHVRSRSWEGTGYLAPGSATPRPVTAVIARNAFCLGFTHRLGQRLASVSSQAHQERAGPSGTACGQRSAPGPQDGAGLEHGREDHPASRGVGSDGQERERVALALRARDMAVTDYYRRVSAARGSWRRSATAAASAAASRRAGERAADEFRRSRLAPGGGAPRGEIGG